MRINKTPQKIKEYASAHRQKKKWVTVVTCLAAVVVFCTTYTLILPAITMEKDVYCDKTEHEHGEDCYEEVLTCTLQESEGHTHTESCYEDGVLACGLEETEGHTHDESCYETVLTCELEEHTNTLTYEGADYTVTVSYGADAKLPGNTELVASEYAKDSETCLARYAEAAELYGWEADYSEDFRLFNIGLYADGEEAEPSAAVKVTVTCFNQDSSDICQVTHFGEEKTETVDATVIDVDGAQTVGFDIDSFSDYGIMMTASDTAGAAATDVLGLDGQSYAIVNAYGTYGAITSGTATVNNVGGLTADSVTLKNGNHITESTTMWTFELYEATADATSNVYYIYTTVNGETKYLTLRETPYIDNSGTWWDRGSLTLGDTPQPITVIYTADGYNLSATVGNDTTYVNRDTVTSNFWCYKEAPADGTGTFLLCDVYEITTVESVTPPGTVINLFDYWIESQDAPDFKQPDHVENDDGINNNHALKFWYTSGNGTYNYWTHGNWVYQGIVASQLGSDGYPYLSKEETGTEESLAYLFNPGVDNPYRAAYTGVSGLFQEGENGFFVYDSTKNYAWYEEDTNSFTLYSDGVIGKGQFFPFNDLATAQQVTGSTDGTGVDERLNHYFGMNMTSRFVQQYDGHTSSSKKVETEFYFSGDDDVWIFIDGVLVADLGGIHNVATVSINFATGKVEINVGNSSGNVDGREVSASQSTTLADAFKAAYGDDYKFTLLNGWTTTEDGDVIFANGTYHTLEFYYLERGNNESNLSLKYNLQYYPETAITKVNQYDEAVSGAVFGIYKARDDYRYISDTGSYIRLNDCSYTIEKETGVITIEGGTYAGQTITPVDTYTTDENGKIVFLDNKGLAYPLSELRDVFGEYFILRELEAPSGYRMVSEEICLQIFYVSTTAGTNYVLLCHNSFMSGVWSSATLQVIAPDTLLLSKTDSLAGVKGVTSEPNGDSSYKNTVAYAEYNPETKSITNTGTLFAVVLKYIGPYVYGDATMPALKNPANWAPVWGTDREGFTVEDEGIQDEADLVAAAIETAKKYTESHNVFYELNASMQADIIGMPGSISAYYYMLKADSKNQTQYTVAYYWSSADSLEEATSDNTYLVDSDSTDSAYTFYRTFGAIVNVPNLINRVYVQKTDSDGELVKEEALFALYEVAQDTTEGATDKDIYYIGKDGEDKEVLIYLYPDDGSEENDDKIAGNNKGKAQLKENDFTGDYEVNSTTGVVTVKIADSQYTITPSDVANTVKADGTDKNGVKNISGEDGTASFMNMENGYYYVREISAPKGYSLNPTEIMVAVSDSAVLANAGTVDNGVTVACGAGYLVNTLSQFASEGEIDNTLSWIYGVLKTTQDDATFAEIANNSYDDETTWKYITENFWDGSEANWKTVRELGVSSLRSRANTKAATTYLEYTAEKENVTFNYNINQERAKSVENAAKNSSGEFTRRLYTQVGWSYLELYQDDEHGLSMIKKTGAAYTLLDYAIDPLDPYTASDGMISDLFSRSVYIRVADEYEPSLAVSKTVVNNSKVDLSEDEFEFNVTLEQSEDVEETDLLAGTYDYAVYQAVYEQDDEGKNTDVVSYYGSNGNFRYASDAAMETGTITISGNLEEGYRGTVTVNPDADSNESEPVNSGFVKSITANEDGTITIKLTLQAGQVFLLNGFERDKIYYTVSETTSFNYTSSAIRDKDNIEDGSDDGDEGDRYGRKEYPDGSVVKGSIHYPVTTVDYTNTYPVTMYIKKVDSDNGTELSGAEFTMYYAKDDGTQSETKVSFVYDEVYKVYKGVEPADENTTTTITAGSVIITGLDAGTYYLVEEKAPDGYATSGPIKIEFKDGMLTSAKIGEVDYSEIMISEDGLNLSVPNAAFYELPSTGGAGTNVYTIGGLLLMAGAVGYGYRLRRRRERRIKN